MADRKVTVRLEVVVTGETDGECAMLCPYLKLNIHPYCGVPDCTIFGALPWQPSTGRVGRSLRCVHAESRETKGAKGDG